MGKHNNQNNRNNNQQRPKPPKNPDPMSNTRTMGKEGMKIIHNIAFGTFNIFNDGHVFRNPDFVKATMVEVEKRLVDARIHTMAIEYAYSGSNDPAVLNLLHRDRKSVEAYMLIQECLSNIIMSYGDTGFLLVLANKLPQFKYNI